MKNIIKNAFIEILSGIARYHKDGGVITENVCGNPITISFPTNSPNYAVERGYYKNGQKRWKIEYQNGHRHGKYIGWRENGQKYFKAEYQNGLRHGEAIRWDENGMKCWEIEYKNGERISERYY